MPQAVRVVPYDPTWPQRFAEERDRLAALLGDTCIAIHHIGSTAIPGADAKPILDLMPVVRDLAAVDALTPAFATLGYEALGEFGIPGRRYFCKGGDERTHQLHIFQVGDHANIVRHLAFRDYLRAHPDDLAAYCALKRDLAQRHPWDIAAYCSGKERLARQIEQRALAWYDPAWEDLLHAARAARRPRAIGRHVEVGAVAAALRTPPATSMWGSASTPPAHSGSARSVPPSPPCWPPGKTVPPTFWPLGRKTRFSRPAVPAANSSFNSARATPSSFWATRPTPSPSATCSHSGGSQPRHPRS